MGTTIQSGLFLPIDRPCHSLKIKETKVCIWSFPTWIQGTQNNGGTSAHQSSESSDSSSMHNFGGGGCECKQTLCLSSRSRIHPKLSTRCKSISF